MVASTATFMIEFGFSESPHITEGMQCSLKWANKFIQNAARHTVKGEGYRKTDMMILIEDDDVFTTLRLDICPALVGAHDPIGEALARTLNWQEEQLETDSAYARYINADHINALRQIVEAWPS